jgi:hypothetical protein
MSSSPTIDLPEQAAAAVNEAAQIAAQAARRQTETAKASIEVARSYLDESSELGHRLYGAWAAGSEAALSTAFDARNAAIEASLGVFDLGVTANRQAATQLTELVRKTQQAAIESWQATVKAGEKLASGAHETGS